MKSKEQIREEKDMELLNKFANDHVCATHIQVDISHHHKSFKPRNNEGAKYEDCNLLSDIIMGAESFMMYLARNGYEIRKVKK